MKWRVFLLAVVLGAALAGVPAVVRAQGTQINFITVEQASRAADETYVFVRARVVSILPPRPESTQPYSVYVADSTGRIRVVIFQDTWRQIPDPAFLIPGSSLDIYGQAGEFRGIRQLAVMKPNHVRLSPDTPIGGRFGTEGSESDVFIPATIGVLNMTALGKKVRIRGNVSEIIPPPRERYPTKVMVTDNTGTIEVIYWEAVGDVIPPEDRPIQGQPIEIRGIVNEYRGVMQLRVDEPSWVSRKASRKADTFGTTDPAAPQS